MIDLAMHREEGFIPLHAIAKRQDITVKYLEQIISLLSRAGFLQSVRGKSGGYRLVREPGEYTVGEILRQLEGNLAPVSCVSGGACCGRADRCVTLEVWQQIQDAVDGVVDNITLADLVRRYREKCPENGD